MNREEFLKELKEFHKPYEALGNKNQAILNHIAKVEKMNDEEFAVHYATLPSVRGLGKADAARMAKIFKK